MTPFRPHTARPKNRISTPPYLAALLLATLVLVTILAGCATAPGERSERGKAIAGDPTQGLGKANSLYDTGHFSSAYPYYQQLTHAAKITPKPSREQLCEAHLNLAEMYFRGRVVTEDWYTGYYYWLQGHRYAESGGNGRCFAPSSGTAAQQARQADRKFAVDTRLERLGSKERKQVETLWGGGGYGGLASVMALPFQRPMLPLPDTKSPLTTHASATGGFSSSANTNGWPQWQALDSGLCALRSADRVLPWSELFQLRSNTIWSVKSQDGESLASGSAVAVAPNRLLTNCHLIKNPRGITLSQGASTVRATVLSADTEGDRCILESGQTLNSFVALAKSQTLVLIGEDVAAIGNPKGLNTSLSRGIVAQKRQREGRAYLQTDTAISSGSSGGGLFDSAGNLVGITTFKVAKGESLNFAIAIDEFCQL